MLSKESASDAPSKLLLTVRRRVVLRDTDAAGLIHYAAVFGWSDMLFTEWLASIGHPLGLLLRGGDAVPVVRTEAEFKTPLGVDDLTELELRADSAGRSSFRLRMVAYRLPARAEAVEIRFWHVHTRLQPQPGVARPSAKSAPLPAWLREALTA